ncbi:MAG: MmcQ/YjbR family DNA-binding protein [Oscillospiraceae bacterium]|nr:MmcQ/YjbR family DNA-binding protein [Oscillospiraceae bacterium]
MKYPWIDEYLLQKKGVTKDHKLEWNWVRYMVGDKLFCAVCLDEEDKPYYITLKLEPAKGDALRKLYPDILPGYYMNKVHWNSVKPNGEVPDELMREMLNEAYELVLSGLPKKKTAEINNI